MLGEQKDKSYTTLTIEERVVFFHKAEHTWSFASWKEVTSSVRSQVRAR